jgi:hypothetical protein
MANQSRKEICERYRMNNREKCRDANKVYRIELKRKAIRVLGDRCNCCGITEWWNLCIDHIEPIMGMKRVHNQKLYILIRDNPIDARNEFQLLCFGCNASKNKYKECTLPHRDDLN